MTEITKFTVGIDFKFNTKGLEKNLKSLQDKFKKNSKFSFEISKFTVDQKRLEIVLGNALDLASRKVSFEISNFTVNKNALNRAVRGFSGTVGGSQGHIVPTYLQTKALDPSEWNRRRAVDAEEWNRRRKEMRLDEQNRLANRIARGPRISRNAGLGGGIGGAIGAGLSGLYGPALAFAAGGYGLGALNKRNQEVVAAQLQTQAVVQAQGGTAAEGQQSFSWLRDQANRVGFNYLQAAPDFNTLMSNLMGAGGTREQAQNVFKGFAEYGRVNKLSNARQSLVFNALSQVAGKNALQAEELTKQLGNSLPGAKSIFAEAWQRKVKGRLTGQEALAALEAAMKKGQVKGDILTFAAQVASERSQPGLTAAQQASQAEQNRFQNTVTDMSILASNKGVEEGFARIFRTLNSGLSEAGPLIEKLANGFNEATKWADDLLLFPQSFMRALEGRDSVVGNWLGSEKVEQMNNDLNVLKGILDNISKIEFPFMPTLESTAQEISGIVNWVGNVGRWFNSASESADIVQRDISYRTNGTPLQNVAYGLGGSLAGLSAFVSTPWDAEQADMYRAQVAQNYPVGEQALVTRRELQGAVQMMGDININIDPVTMAQMDVNTQAQALADQLKMELESATLQFPIKE